MFCCKQSGRRVILGSMTPASPTRSGASRSTNSFCLCDRLKNNFHYMYVACCLSCPSLLQFLLAAEAWRLRLTFITKWKLCCSVRPKVLRHARSFGWLKVTRLVIWSCFWNCGVAVTPLVIGGICRTATSVLRFQCPKLFNISWFPPTFSDIWNKCERTLYYYVSSL